MELLIEKIKSLKDVFEPLDFCVFVKDPEGRIIYMNPAFAKFTGYSFGEILYEKTDSFLKGNTLLIRESLLDDVKILSGATQKTTRVLHLYNAHNEIMVMRLIKTPLTHQKKIIGILGVAENVSDNYRLHYICIERTIQKLSPAERRVLFMYSRGLNRAEVAKALSLSPSTADTLWQRAREKLDLANDDLKLFLRFFNDLIDNTYTD
jgi:PAS domain S-box-containing protein